MIGATNQHQSGASAEPNVGDIRAHLEWIVEPARGAYDDALVEIAVGQPSGAISSARLFALDDLETAASFAAEQNRAGRNVYVGAALRLPDADRNKRASNEDFYVSTTVPIDIDQNYDAIRGRMAACCDDGLVVTTGLTPERRSQHWVRLNEPCDDVTDFGRAFAALVSHTGADQAVKDAARVMRLGGTVSFPNERKVAKGYSVELTTVAINPLARPSSIEALCRLDPAEELAGTGFRPGTGRPSNTAIERDQTSRVINGRELHWRNELLRGIREFQETNGADPTADDLWEQAWSRFSNPEQVDNTDMRWTSPEGQGALRQRLRNTLRRLRLGRLAPQGLYSYETGAGQSTAETAKAARDAARNRCQRGPDVDPEPISRGTASEAEPPLEPAAELPPHLLECFGLVGEIAAFITSTARFPQPVLALGAALCIVGTAAGRRYAGPTRSGTHLYTLVMAKTGAGKNHAAKMGARIMEAAFMGDHIGPAQYMSMSAVFQDLSREPLKLAFIDEFGGYMSRIASSRGSPHERAVKDVLRTAWGQTFEVMRPLAYAGVDRKLEAIHGPALSIYAMSTPEEFYQAVQGTDVYNGFLNRWLMLPTDLKPAEVDPEVDEFEIPRSIIDGLTRIMDAVAPNGLCPAVRLDWESAEARLHYKAFRTAVADREEDAALMSRVAEMAVRLATIRALGRSSILPAVRLSDIQWACELALWSAERMRRDARAYMVESEHQGRAKLVLRLLREAPRKRLTRSELTRRIQHQFDARTLDSVIQGLRDADEIAVLEAEPGKQTTGRKGVVYALV